MPVPPLSFGDKSVIGGSEREAALLGEIREWQQRWRDECRLREKLNADFMSAQKQWERYGEETRLKHEQEVSKLRQQLYILEAKVCQTDPIFSYNNLSL